MKAVLVTGSTGNVGAEVVAQLLRRDVPVRAAVRPGSLGSVAPGATPVEFDFEDASTFGPSLDGVDRVFLMRPPHMADAGAFRPFVDAMLVAEIRQVVFLSVQGAGSNVFVPHHGIETLLKRSGLMWTFLRPSFFMENLSTTHLADIRDRGEIFVPAGRGRTNFIEAADVGEAAAVCLMSSGHNGEAYEIMGSEALKYREVAAILSTACGCPIVYSRPSAGQFRTRMRLAGHDEEFVRVMSSIYAIARFGLAAGTTLTFGELVGREPRTFVDWAERNAACFVGDGRSACGNLKDASVE